MGLSANRREIDEKRPQKRVRSKIITPPTRLTTSSESDRSPQLAENKGFLGVLGHYGSSVQNYLSTHLAGRQVAGDGSPLAGGHRAAK